MATILSSAARTEAGTQTFSVPSQCSALLIQYAVSAAATEVEDVLAMWVQGSVDGGASYYDIGRFADVLGNGGAKKFIMALQRTGSIAESDIVTPTDAAMAAATVNYGPFPDKLRLKWTVTDEGAVKTNASFTFAVDVAVVTA